MTELLCINFLCHFSFRREVTDGATMTEVTDGATMTEVTDGATVTEVHD